MNLLTTTALTLALTGSFSLTPAQAATPGPEAPTVAQASEKFMDLFTSATVYLSVNGRGNLYSLERGATTEALLRQAGVTLKPGDRLSVPVKSVVTDKQFITLTSPTVRPFTKTLPVAYTKVKRGTVTCPAPGSKVTQKGAPGVLTESWQAFAYNGVAAGERLVASKVTTPAVQEVTASCVVLPKPKPAPRVVAPAPQAVAPAPATPAPAPTTSGNSPLDSSYYSNQYFGGTATTPVTPAPPQPQLTGGKQEWMKAAGIPESDWSYVDYIITKESGWRVTVKNPKSPAYGLCQALPGSKMASAGADWATNPVTQLKWCNGYAQQRYGSWIAAHSFWLANSWW